MVPEIPGYDQVRDFYKRMALKMADASTIGLGYDFSKMLAQNPGAGQALGDMAKEMQKLDGVPIMQVMRMGTTTDGQPLPAASEAPTPAPPAGPSAGDVAKQGMTSALTSHFGLGGFGKKKQDPPPPDPNQNARATDQRHPDGNPDQHFEFFLGPGRSVAFRCSGRLQADTAADADSPLSAVIPAEDGLGKQPRINKSMSPFEGGPNQQGTRRGESNGFWFSISRKNSDRSIFQLTEPDDLRIGVSNSRLLPGVYLPIPPEPGRKAGVDCPKI